MEKKFIILLLFSLSAKVSTAQIPQEYIMGKLTMDAGRFGYSGIYTGQPDKSSSFGSFLKYSMIVPSGNNYSEVSSDVGLATVLQLINGLSNLSRLSFTEIKDYEESNVGTPDEGNRLFQRSWNLLAVSQSFKVYDNFMIGYHAGAEGMTANETDANLELTEARTLDITYWTIGPVLAYQNNDLRVEAKWKYLLGKKVSEGRNLCFKADYFITNNAESLSVAVGVYADKIWFDQAEFENTPQVNVSSFGVSLSFLYPSIWSLIGDN